jgi:hypothetical protein
MKKVARYFKRSFNYALHNKAFIYLVWTLFNKTKLFFILLINNVMSNTVAVHKKLYILKVTMVYSIQDHETLVPATDSVSFGRC